MALSADEETVYDRQLRLWGAEAQMRMKQCRLLMLQLDAVTAEVAKNLALSGFSITVADERPATKAPGLALLSGLPLTDGVCGGVEEGLTVGEMAVRSLSALNPLAKMAAVSFEDHSDEFLKSFDLIVASRMSLSDAVALGSRCRHLGVNFTTIRSHGPFSVVIQDHGSDFAYVLDEKQGVDGAEGKKSDESSEVRHASFPTIEDAVAFSAWSSISHRLSHPLFLALCVLDDSIRVDDDVEGRYHEERVREKLCAKGCDDAWQDSTISFLSELLPVWSTVDYAAAAIAGGEIALDLIRLVSHRGEPACNILSINSNTSDALTFCIPPPKPSSIAAPEEDVLDLSSSDEEDEEKEGGEEGDGGGGKGGGEGGGSASGGGGDEEEEEEEEEEIIVMD